MSEMKTPTFPLADVLSTITGRLLGEKRAHPTRLTSEESAKRQPPMRL
jgi:hypothetical protein